MVRRELFSKTGGTKLAGLTVLAVLTDGTGAKQHILRKSTTETKTDGFDGVGVSPPCTLRIPLAS